jgi:hypothetical protein
LYGFSLRWHPGYGYGRYALGVGADGGYPFYGGPGYPHEPPRLNRFGPATPYLYFGGPGHPILGWSNFYQGIGGLVVDKPVVAIAQPGDFDFVGENGEINPGRDFGAFTGALPYPETYFAPYAAATGSFDAQSPANPPSTTPSPAPSVRSGSPSALLPPARGDLPTAADLSAQPVRAMRPSYLPPVGNGPPPLHR